MRHFLVFILWTVFFVGSANAGMIAYQTIPVSSCTQLGSDSCPDEKDYSGGNGSLSPKEELQGFKIDLLEQIIQAVMNLDANDFDPVGKPLYWEEIVYQTGDSLCPDSPEYLCQDYLASLSLPTKMDNLWIKVSGQIPAVPEPGTGLLVCVGLAGLVLRRNAALHARR